MKRFLPLVVLPLLVGACTSTGSVGMLMRSSASPIQMVKEKSYKEIGKVSGKGCRTMLLGIFSVGNADIGRLTDRVLQENKADALVNATTSNSLYGYIPVYNIFSITCTRITGTAVRFE